MKIFILSVITASLFLISCKKDSEDASLLIRIKNNTNKKFINAFKDEAGYGSINSGLVTEYKIFDKVVAYPSAIIVIASDTLYAGFFYFCGTPPVPYLEKGKYTLEISENPSTLTMLDAKYIKD